MSEKGHVVRKEWKEFRDAGLLWWINRILHLFGWALVYQCDMEDDNKTVKAITDVYPARVRYRGFQEGLESEGFIRLTKYLAENVSKLQEEANE